MGADSSLRDLNSELDVLSLKILQLMNSYIESKVKLEEAMKNGCLDLAKTRYIRGGASISAVQLPTEDSIGVKALTKVESSAEEPDNCISFKLVCEESTPSTKDSPRIKADGYIIEEEKHSASEKISDPLKWFGVLVPQNLRQAQTWFKHSIELAVDCINIQADIESKRQEFIRLSKLKRDSFVPAEGDVRNG